MTKDEWMKDGTEYCCYCGTPKVSFGCCGENHFETFAQMSSEAQDEFLQYEDEDTAELEKIMLEVWQPVQQEQALQRMTDNAEELGLYKREWVGLTNEEVRKCYAHVESVTVSEAVILMSVVRITQAMLKGKNS